MTITGYLKAAAKTVAAFIVAWLGLRGIDVDLASLEIVLTGVFVGLGSIVLNVVLHLLNKTPIGDVVGRVLPSYPPEST